MDVLESRIKSLTKKEREEFEAAKRRGYLIDRSRARDDLETAYMTWCDITKTPYIAVRRRRVKFWFLSGSAYLSDQGIEDVRALFQKYSVLDDEEYNGVYANCGEAIAILPEDLECLARSLFLTLRKPGIQDRSMKDICPPLSYEHSPRAWLEEQSIPRGWDSVTNAQGC